MTNRWLLIRYDCLGGLAVLTTSLFALSTNVDKPGWAGWAALCLLREGAVEDRVVEVPTTIV